MRRVRRLPEGEFRDPDKSEQSLRRDDHIDALIRLQRAAGNASVTALIEEEGASAASSVKQVLGSGTGRPIDDATRESMEARLGQDLSGVKIHADSRAAQSAAAVNA